MPEKKKADNGTRSSYFVRFFSDFDLLGQRLTELLNSEKYFFQTYVDETLHRRGKGIFAVSKMIKFMRENDGIRIEAFVVNFGVKESSLEGFVGALPKNSSKNTVNKMIALIEKQSSR